MFLRTRNDYPTMDHICSEGLQKEVGTNNQAGIQILMLSWNKQIGIRNL